METTTQSQHSFPSDYLNHSVTLKDGRGWNLLVAPSETFGKALARQGIPADEVASVELGNGAESSYEPDWSVASR
jgi:hypothetical protein